VRSLVLPGWGQLANGHPSKAAGFAVGAGVLVGMAAQTQSDLDRIGDRLAALQETAPGSSALAALRQRQQDLAARRNSRVLLVVVGAVAAGLDAYVDAHLAGFDAEDDALALIAGPTWLSLAVSRRW
jgi:hypothetical protein